jgi:hypothetical protein
MLHNHLSNNISGHEQIRSAGDCFRLKHESDIAAQEVIGDG